jgi:excisionase family DNA binding protein
VEYAPPLAYTISEAAKTTGLGRTTIYELIGTGEIEARKAGGRTLVMAGSLHSYIASLPAAKIAPPKRRSAPQMQRPEAGGLQDAGRCEKFAGSNRRSYDRSAATPIRLSPPSARDLASLGAAGASPDE